MPFGGVVSDSSGNLYGATSSGGDCNSDAGYGTVFQVAPDGTESVLHAFQGAADGALPNGNLVRDQDGNLYGTAALGGMAGCGGDGCGVVFDVTPAGEETVIHEFQSGTDGAVPGGGVMFDDSGNLFGTTEGGGGSTECSGGCGTVFEIASDGTEQVLYSFQGGSDGWGPRSYLILDQSGDLYGTTFAGGTNGFGTVFKVTPAGTESLLYSFKNGSDGSAPDAGLVMDDSENLYGTTSDGGGGCHVLGCGTVFEVSANGAEKVLYSFRDQRGRHPDAGLLLGAHGELYSTASAGGDRNSGTIFRLKK